MTKSSQLISAISSDRNDELCHILEWWTTDDIKTVLRSLLSVRRIGDRPKGVIQASPSLIAKEKSKLKRALRRARLTQKDLADHPGCQFHYQTVKAALNERSTYWNQKIADLIAAIESKTK